MKRRVLQTICIAAFLVCLVSFSGCGTKVESEEVKTGSVEVTESVEKTASVENSDNHENLPLEDSQKEEAQEASTKEESTEPENESLSKEVLPEIEYPYSLNEKTYEKVTLENLCTMALPNDMKVGEYSKNTGFGGGYLLGTQIYSDNSQLGSDSLWEGFVGLMPKEFYVFNLGENGFADPEKVTLSPKAGFSIVEYVEVVDNTEKNCIVYSYDYDFANVLDDNYEAPSYLEAGKSEEDYGKFWIAYLVDKDDMNALELKFSKAYFTLEEVEFMARSVRFE